jgi:hypothetical protein
LVFFFKDENVQGIKWGTIFWSENLKGAERFEDLSVDRKIVLR